jgi:small-conductance mechanosensitive channel
MNESLKELLFDPTVGRIVAVLIALILLGVLVTLLKRSLSRRIVDLNSRYRVRKIINFTGYIIGFIIIGVVFSSKLTGLTVAFGVAGAGIAFALQEVIASVAGWIAISFGGFYKIGDRVQLGGIKGDVIDIGILRTTVMEIGQWVNGDQYNGRVVRVANSFIFKEPVFNYSGDFPFLWDEITIPIKYGSDLALAREILNTIAKEELTDFAQSAKLAWKKLVEKFMIENAAVDPMVTMVANDNWVEFSLRYVVDFKRRRSTKDILFSKILQRIDLTEGRVGMASATFHVVGMPPVNVHLPDRINL